MGCEQSKVYSSDIRKVQTNSKFDLNVFADIQITSSANKTEVLVTQPDERESPRKVEFPKNEVKDPFEICTLPQMRFGSFAKRNRHNSNGQTSNSTHIKGSRNDMGALQDQIDETITSRNGNLEDPNEVFKRRILNNGLNRMNKNNTHEINIQKNRSSNENDSSYSSRNNSRTKGGFNQKLDSIYENAIKR